MLPMTTGWFVVAGLVVAGLVGFGVWRIRLLVESKRSHPYEPDYRYDVTQPGANWHGEHPVSCQCPSCLRRGEL